MDIDINELYPICSNKQGLRHKGSQFCIHQEMFSNLKKINSDKSISIWPETLLYFIL